MMRMNVDLYFAIRGSSCGLLGLMFSSCGSPGRSWPLLGLSWPILGLSWPLLGLSWALLGRSGGRLGHSKADDSAVASSVSILAQASAGACDSSSFVLAVEAQRPDEAAHAMDD